MRLLRQQCQRQPRAGAVGVQWLLMAGEEQAEIIVGGLWPVRHRRRVACLVAQALRTTLVVIVEVD